MNLNLSTRSIAIIAAALAASISQAQPPGPGGRPAQGGPCPADGYSGGFRQDCPQKQFANPADISAMMAALPDKPVVTPQAVRRVLVLAKAAGFVHSSIPLSAKMVEYLGDRTGAWMTTISYDPSVVNAENLKRYDAIFLASTTGEFLDDAKDQASTDARRKAFMEFLKSGKGVAGIHAATDSYHVNERPATPSAAAPMRATWPEFNEAMGGFFKYHWNYPTLIPIKIDDPKSPLTAMFPARGYEAVDETYTFAQDSFSRKRVHVLTSVNYARMSAEDKAKEPAGSKRTDGDYALSYIQKVGEGRVFYQSHGHDEKIYFSRPFLQHMLAGIQYAIGDLKADDSPSEK